MQNGLGFPQAYLGLWPHTFPLEDVAIDPSYDPAEAEPVPGEMSR